MKGRPTILALLLLPSALPAAAQFASDPQPPSATLALVGGLLVDGHEGPPIYDSVLLIDARRSLGLAPATP